MQRKGYKINKRAKQEMVRIIDCIFFSNVQLRRSQISIPRDMMNIRALISKKFRTIFLRLSRGKSRSIKDLSEERKKRKGISEKSAIFFDLKSFLSTISGGFIF
jgi:hypothetical protein